jgi:NADPH:quinone reductase-like Zn-dependent oxidoreductase
LNDLSLFGCTFQEDEVFKNIVEYVDRGELRPVVSRMYRLDEIARAQEEFLEKDHIGKLVLVPPTDRSEVVESRENLPH